MGRRRIAVGAAAVLSALEVAEAFRIGRPIAALAFAVLFALGAILVARGSRWASLLIAIPAVIDLVGVLTFFGPPEGGTEVTIFVVFGVLSALALVTATWIMLQPGGK